jgi:drug/metabolite transporter (DMT)-like permease
LPTERAERLGVLLAAIGAVSYGVTVVVGEDLADAGMGPTTALGVRFTVGGVILALVLRARRVALFPSRREVLVAFGLGLVYAVESTLFFSALERGTAAAVALVFYVYPAMVTVYELARGTERAHRTTLVALGMSMIGTAVVVVGGGEVALTPAGVAFALGSAATFSAYLLFGRGLTRGTDPMVIACWVGLGAGVANLLRGVVSHELTNPSHRVIEIVVYGASTAIAFTLTFAAMSRIGASRVAVIMTLEAVASVVMAAVFLGESVRAVQALGGVVVLAAAAVIARGQPPDVATAIEAAPAAGT